MNEITQEKYAKLILKKGINIEKGQCIRINATINTYKFAQIILKEAYKLGAQYVIIDVISDYNMLHRIENSEENFLTYLPDFNYATNNLMIAEKWAFISIANTEEFDILKNANTEKIQLLTKTFQQYRKKLRNELMSDRLAWTVVAYPTPQWVQRIYGSNKSDEFENVFNQILRLHHDDPILAWDEHGATLKERCHYLNELNIDKLIFKNQFSHLEIGLTDFSLWHGGPAFLNDGREFMPNLPTEEVFTTPHFERTNGHVQVVKPVEVFGTTITNLYLEFKDGKVHSFKADSGYETMEKYLSIDAQASFLGEIALVDLNSPINKSNLYFNNILFDENASSHIALGGGYPSCLSNNDSLKNEEEILSVGCNVSSVHTDFMIGNENTEITAYLKDGSSKVIMKNGLFVD